jgi:hypothetical protein
MPRVNGGGKTAGIETPARSRNGKRIVISAKSRPGCRIRRAVSREFILSDGQPILVRSVLKRCYPRLRTFKSWHYDAARKALRKVAAIIARNRFGRGRPALWAPIAPSRP